MISEERKVWRAQQNSIQAKKEAKSLSRKNLEAHYACAVANWNLCMDELDELRRNLKESK